MGQPELQCAPILGGSDTAAMHHYRVRVWNQGSGGYDCPPPLAEAVSISYSIHAKDEDDAMRQALARFERHTGYREPDAYVCFLAEWLDVWSSWGVIYGLAGDPDGPSKARSPLDDRTVHWL